MTAGSELRAALASCRSALVGIAIFSGLINLLGLTGSLFMLEVYDRVLPSRSVPTLVGLAVITALLFIFQGILELTRGRMLVRIGSQIDWRLSDRVYDLVVRQPLRTRGSGDGQQPIRDLDTIRSVLSGSGPAALFDLPWLPFYLAICFAFHPLIGGTALGGALVLVILTLLTDRLSRRSVQKASSYAAARNRLADASRRNAEVLVSMAMSARLLARWRQLGVAYRKQQKTANDISGGFGVTGRMLRMMLQSAVLAVGAYLVIHQEASGGIIIASSILTGRALAPVDLAIGNWKNFIAARQSWQRLEKLLTLLPAAAVQLPLPAPTRTLVVEKLSVMAPESEKLLVADVSFFLKAGNALAIVGASGSGKSSLVRALVGDGVRAVLFGWTGRPWNNGRPTLWAVISDTCRRTSNCSRAPSPKILPDLPRNRRWRRCSPPRMRPAYIISSLVCRRATTPRSVNRARCSRPAKSSAWRWPARFTAIPF
jgi:ATP-binding cassette subfamily C protein